MSDFDPLEFLHLAKQLCDSANQTEGGYRTAISRAYYAALWVARSKVQDTAGYGQFYADRSHDEVWDFLGSDVNDRGESLGEIGRDLKRLRVRADYRLQRTIGYADAFSAVRRAESLITDLENL